MGLAGRLLDLDDLLEDRQVVARQEGAAIDDHVDLVGAGCDRRPDLGDLDVTKRLARGKPGRDAGDLDGRAAERLLGLGDERGVDADRRHGRDGRVARLWAHGLDAHRPDLAGRVLPLEGGQVHHRDRQLERPHLRGLLDRAPLERIDPLLDPDLVDRGDPPEQTAERPRAPVPGPDQLVGMLTGGRIGAPGGRHGTVRIHLVPRGAAGPKRPAARSGRRFLTDARQAGVRQPAGVRYAPDETFDTIQPRCRSRSRSVLAAAGTRD